jgi:peroxiredoxin
VCVRHELWTELLDLERAGFFEPTSDAAETIRRALAFGAAHYARNDRERAEEFFTRLNNIKKQAQVDNRPDVERLAERATAELLGHQLLAMGNVSRALARFEEAESTNSELLARLHMKLGNVVKASELTADSAGRVDRLACRVEVLHGLNRKDEARKTFEQLRQLADRSDLGLPALRRLKPIARSFGFPDNWQNMPTPAVSAGERKKLDDFGPLFWQPWTAPAWKLSDIDGKPRGLDEFRGRPILVIFYLGKGCIHCVEQLQMFNKMADKFAKEKIAIIAIGDDPRETMQRSRDAWGNLSLTLLSDVKHETFRKYTAFDDFEKMPLHGTFLIDGQGQVRWQDVGADPFMDAEFLLTEAPRLLRQPPRARAIVPPPMTRSVPLTEGDGLYGSGRNTPPDDHLKWALAETRRIAPLNAQGQLDAQGRIVILGVGGGQAGDIFSRFKSLADADPERARSVVLVDGTQWDREASMEETVSRRLDAAGMSPRQVQAVWWHHDGPFDGEAQMKGLRERFPNLRGVWLSSAVYGGYAVEGRETEPSAYESGLAVRGVIVKQIQGDDTLKKGPPLLWGPYLWADGQTWSRDDFLADGVQLSEPGRDKAAKELTKYFKDDIMTRSWFRK